MSRTEVSPFRRVTIVGLGLMGGSIARALKSRDPSVHIRATSLDPEDIAAGLDRGVLDAAPEGDSDLMEGQDLVVYATPLPATLGLLAKHRPHLTPDTVLTDVVSLKAPVLQKVALLDLGDRFVGSHPMVGDTRTGFDSSRPDLYEGATVWVVPGEDTPLGTTERVKDLWRFLGAEPVLTGATDHDGAMVLASHLPQLTSNALATVLRNAGVSRTSLGSGGRDMTRLAGSSWSMWEGLFHAAPDSLPSALKALEATLAELRGHLEAGRTNEIGKIMDETRRWLEENQ